MVRRRISGWWAGLLWLIGLHAALAQEVLPAPAMRAIAAPAPIQLSAGQFMATLDEKSRYWIETGASRTVEQVAAETDSLPWATRESGRQYRIDGSALWFLFDAVAPGDSRWYLQIGLSGLDRAQLFYRNSAGRWVTQEAGDTLPVAQWPLPGRVPTFELSTTPDTPVRYWLRIEHQRFDFAAPIAIYSQAALFAAREREQFLLGGYFGLAALIALVAAANAFVFRDRNFGVYAVYVLAMGVGQAAYLGVGAQHVWEHWLWWNKTSTMLLPSVSAATALWFVRTVTEPARFSRALDTAVWLGILALLGSVAVDTAVPSRLSVAVVTGFVALSMVLVVLLIALVWTHGDDPDIRLIALGFLPVLVFAAFPVLRTFNIIPSGLLTRYGISIGAALEMPILFYALSARGSRRREAQTRADALPHTDALTGLADRRSLLQRLESTLHRARSQHHSCALMAVKLGNYEQIASEHGRETAERALVVAASALHHAMSDIDLAARIGDRDFALLLEGPTSPETAIARAQQVVAKGLQQAPSLPRMATLKFQVAVALLPDKELQADASLKWVQEVVNAMRPDTRKLIRPLNF